MTAFSMIGGLPSGNGSFLHQKITPPISSSASDIFFQGKVVDPK